MAPYSININNTTDENISFVIFKKPFKAPSLDVLAWEIVSLPGSGRNTSINIPTNYDVYIDYSTNPRHRQVPNSGAKTALIPLDQQTTKFIVREEKTNDNNVAIATLNSAFTDIVGNEVHIVNQASFLVWGHILLNGQDVYPPQVIEPEKTLMEDVRSPFYLAVIDKSVEKGTVMKVEKLSSPAIEVLAGDSITITGSKQEGFNLSK